MSKWQEGVQKYANELKQDLRDEGLEVTEKNLLNGARTWHEYSAGGNSLIYDWEIAKRLATTSEIKKRTRKDGSLNPMANSRESWLDVQARALFQASCEVLKGAKND